MLLFATTLLILAPASHAQSAAGAYARPSLPAATAHQSDRFFAPRNAGGVTAAGTVTALVSAGGSHTCGLKSDGHLLCWGNDSNSQVSHAPPITFTQVSAGDAHTCALKDDGTAACWGNGQSTPPTDTLKMISAGLEHNCAIKTNGTEICWGAGNDGQTAQQAGTFTQISAGGFHTCGIKNDGTAICWGNNIAGQTAQQAGTFTQISAGGFHTCGLRSSGAVECWGQASDGQTTVVDGTYKQVSAGAYHTCGLKTDGTIACWGKNTNGQATAPAGTFTQVSAGGAHSCAVDTAGGFRCWGWNQFGQAESRYKPTITTQPSSPSQFTAGQSLSLHVAASGGPPPSFQWRKDTHALPNQTGDTLSIPTLQLGDSGSYDVVVSNSMGSATSNAVAIAVVRLSQTLSVEQAPNKRYGDDSFQLHADATSGLPVVFSVLAGPASISRDEVTILGAGTVQVLVSQPGNGTYSPAPTMPLTFTIERAALTITADDKTRYFGEPNPDFTATYTGFAYDDTADDLDTKPNFTVLVGSGSPPGDYQIYVSGATDAKYIISMNNGTLHIIKRLVFLPAIVRTGP
jgi:hypothetical protein